MKQSIKTRAIMINLGNGIEVVIAAERMADLKTVHDMLTGHRKVFDSAKVQEVEILRIP